MIGRELSHFRITAKLGEGGMGEVYRAEDVALGREVAIKVLPRAVAANPERLARFEREARVLASLNHPNVGAVYEVGQGTASGSSSDDETAEPGAPPRAARSPTPRLSTARLPTTPSPSTSW